MESQGRLNCLLQCDKHGISWLARRYSLNHNFSFLNRISQLFNCPLEAELDPVPDPAGNVDRVCRQGLCRSRQVLVGLVFLDSFPGLWSGQCQSIVPVDQTCQTGTVEGKWRSENEEIVKMKLMAGKILKVSHYCRACIKCSCYLELTLIITAPDTLLINGNNTESKNSTSFGPRLCNKIIIDNSGLSKLKINIKIKFIDCYNLVRKANILLGMFILFDIVFQNNIFYYTHQTVKMF